MLRSLHRRRIARKGPGGPDRRLSGRRGTEPAGDRRRAVAAARGDTAAAAGSGSNPDGVAEPAGDRRRIAAGGEAAAAAARRTSGLWRGKTIGSPIALLVANQDHTIEQLDEPNCPRPGHGDLAGAIKHLGPIRGVLERASARETAARVAAGAVARQLLAHFGIDVFGYVIQIGPMAVPPRPGTMPEQRALRDRSELYTLDPDQDAQLKTLIDQSAAAGRHPRRAGRGPREGVPFGLGSHTQWDRKLDGRLAQAVMSVQAIKGVEIGLGFESARRPGSEVHDPIHYDPALADGPVAGFHAAEQPCRRPGGGHEQRPADRPPRRHEADRHPGAAPAIGQPCETLRAEPASYQRSDVSPWPRQAAWSRTSSPSRSPAPWSISSAATAWRKCWHDGNCFTGWQERKSSNDSRKGASAKEMQKQ